MGIIHVNVNRSDPVDTGEEARVMVDTGATLSVFPASLLDRLGVRPTGERRFRGFGGVVTREVGGAHMSYAGVSADVTVVFGEEGDPAIMGVTALESLGYQIDPVAGELHRVDMLLF